VAIDQLDARIVRLLLNEPRIGVLEVSRRLRVARGTVQARLDRLLKRGVIRSFAPQIDPSALGYGVTAFAMLEIRQGARELVAAHLMRIPEVLEVHTITGQADLLCRIVARDNADLQRVLDDLVADENIAHTSTFVALSTVVPARIVPLIDESATQAGDEPAVRGRSSPRLGRGAAAGRPAHRQPR
jgi:DNA-binding Lrp family transcriptional regulator